MSRFILSPYAQRDLTEIRSYFDRLPKKPTQAVAAELSHMLHRVGQEPYLGVSHSELTRAFGEDIRSRLAAGYRIFYRVGKRCPEILAVLHGSRDQQMEMLRRVQ